ncbi:MAG: hypothetical protein RRB13_14455 [bacterium]|nr:hypothetical protein [bacterium]
MNLYRPLHATTAVLLGLFGAAHIGYGETLLVEQITATGAGESLVGSLRVMSLQGGLMLWLAAGMHLNAALGRCKLVGALGRIPIAIMGFQLLGFLVIASLAHPALFGIAAPQLGFFALLMGLQFYLTRLHPPA